MKILNKVFMLFASLTRTRPKIGAPHNATIDTSMSDREDYYGDLPYESLNNIDFSVITMGIKKLPFYEDDLYLGMQAMNIGISDSVITDFEYALLREYFEIERTPVDTALAVSALSQMWVYGLYEVLRMWRDRKHQFNKLFMNGGIDLKISDMPDDDPINITIETRKSQLTKYKDDPGYRQEIDEWWNKIEPVYRMAELYRINMAKHSAPGKDTAMPRAPGYGRINKWCGAMDYELIQKDSSYTVMNRRDIADALRKVLVNP